MEPAPVMAVGARIDRLAVARGALSGAHALWVFDKGGTLQRVQHAIKYGDRPVYGVALGRLLGDSFRTAGWDVPDAVVPVPLHRLRELERGYNQAEMLGRGVAEALGVPVDASLLSRPSPTRSQTRLSRTDRWKNVSGAFAVPPGADGQVAGRTLLLVDDVLTTGSTAVAAAQTLLAAGAARVMLATLAMART
jgi:ComF family protein